MKKLAFIISLLLCAVEGIAQGMPELKYELDFKITNVVKSGSHANSYVVGAYISSGLKEKSLNPYNGSAIEIDPSFTKIIMGIYNNGGGYLNSHNNTTPFPYHIDVSYPCMYKEETVKCGFLYEANYTITYSLTIQPKNITLKYSDFNGKSDELILYDKKNISLRTNFNNLCGNDYTNSANIFEFQINGHWYQYATVSSSIIDLSGEQIFSGMKNHSYFYTDPNADKPPLDDFPTIAKNNPIKVRLRPGNACGCSSDMLSNELTLHPRISAPTITSVETEKEKCYNSGDGKIIVHFSRALYEGETLDVMLSLKNSYEGKVVYVPALSDSCVIDNLSAGEYDIILSGRYPYFDADNITYVLDNNHKAYVTLYPPNEITVFDIFRDPYCNKGSDGYIRVNTYGGTNKFYAKYSDIDSTDWFYDYESQTIPNLPAGTYTIHVRDENGCYPKDENDQEITITRTLTQPNQVELTVNDINNPTGYGLANGNIEITTTGGTSGYTCEWKKDGTPFTPSSPDYADNLGAGKYFITVKDSNFSNATEANCRGCFDTMTIVLTQPDPLEVQVVEYEKIKCKGDANGSIKVSVQGGVKPYKKYILTTNENNGSEQTFPDDKDNVTVNSLSKATYKVTVIDNNGNSTTSAAFVLTEPDALTISTFDYANPSCNGFVNGSAQVTVQGGTSPYTYSWKHNYQDKGTNSNSIAGLSAGSLSITVTDANGCSVNSSKTLTDPTQLTADYTVTLPSAYNTSNGQITVTANGGTGSYSYKLDNSSPIPSNVITNLPARDNPYKVTVTDANGCTTTLSDIYIIYPLNVSITEEQAILCYGGTGTLKATATGGTASKTYQWYKKDGANYTFLSGKTTATLSNITTGTYRIEVKDNRNNTASKDFTLSQPSELKATYDITLPSAYNASDGKITITPSGGASPYSYSWDYNNSTSNPLTNIPARDNPYKVKVTDKNQCSVELNPRVIYELTVKITVENSIPCYGGTGTLKATGTGGVGTNYTYQWYRISGNQKTPSGTGTFLPEASAGKYSVTVTDAENNEAQSSDFDLVQPAQLNAGYTITIPSTHNASDGKIEISPSGGTGAYTYKLDGNQVTNPITGLSARENPYTVTVTDANQCSVELKPRIIYPLSIKIEQASPIACYGGKGVLQAVAVGGVGTNYSYQWYSVNQDNTETKISSATNATFETTTGKYRVKATDKESVSATSGILEIKQPDLLTAEYTVAQPSAYNASDGTITVVPSGGIPPYSYTLDNAPVTNPIGGISAKGKPYAVTVIDSKGCTTTLDDIYMFYYPMEITIVENKAIKCFGEKGELKADVTGGADRTYSWYVKNASNNFELLSGQTSVTLTDVVAGTYRVRVKDSNDTIKYSGEFELTQPTKFTASFEKQLPSAYNASDGAIVILPSGGVAPYSYSWNYNNSTANPLENIPAKDDPYKVTVSDANGCSETLDIEIIYPLEVKAEITTTILCHGGTGTLTATATGGVGTDYSYEWYRIEDVYYEEPLNVNNSVLTNVSASKYRVKATDSKNTTAVSETIDLIQPDKLTAEYKITLPTAYDASDGKITVTTSGGVLPYSYSWDYNSSTANPLENIPANDNPYKVRITDANGCNTELNPRVIYPLSVEIAVMDSISCFGGVGTLKATATGGVGKNYSYKWYKISSMGTSQLLQGENSSILTNALTGIYRVEATDIENNLKQSGNLILPQPSQLTAWDEITLPSTYNASDGKITVNPSGGVPPYSYSWNYSSSTANSLEDISANDEPYRVVVSDAKGCTKELYLRVIYPLEVEISVTDSIPCHNGTGTLKAAATGGVGTNYSYQWYRVNQDNTETVISSTNAIFSTGTGKYSVKATDKENNTAISSAVELTHPDLLTAEYTISLPSAHNTSNGKIEITPGGGIAPYSYSWDYNSSTSNPLEDIPANDNPYKVTVTDVKGCSKTLDDIYVIYYPVTVEIVIDKPVSCYGGSDGKLRAVAAGGITKNRKYQWYKVIDGGEYLIPDSTNITLSNTGAGIYRVQTVDMRDSTTISENFEFSQPDLLTAKYDITPPSAYNSSDGIIEITQNGGTAPYSCEWNYKNLTSNPLKELPADDNPYTVKIYDSRGCTETLHPRVLYYPVTVEIVQEKPVSCYGENDGKLRATATGGVTANRIYKWSKIVNGFEIIIEEGKNIDTLVNVGKGIYRVEVTDVQDSTAISEYIEIVQPDLLTAEETITLPSAYNSSDGKITITPTGGTLPYFYKWNYDSSTANPLENIPANDSPYNVTVTDSRGCLTTLVPRIIYPLAVEITLVDSISCYLGSDGTLKAAATGGVGVNYSYKWHKVELGNDKLLDGDENTLSGVDAGKYYVEATDIEGNKASSTYFDFNHPAQLKIDYEVILTSSADASDGIIETAITGGTPEYSYFWDYQNNITGKLTGLPSGQTVYKLTVTDSRGCSDSIRTRLVYPLKVNISVEDSISCYGNTDGRLKANASGGLSKDYEYQWYKLDKGTETIITGATGTELPNAGAGIYRVRVTGLEENTAFADLTFNSPDLLVVTYDISLPSAYNASDGVIKLNVTGGTPEYSCAWNYNNTTGFQLTGIPANDEPYTVTVSDTRNCVATVDPRIIYPLEVKIVVDDSISCYERRDGRLKATATGGVGVNYSYQWYKSENEMDISISDENAITLSGVGKGVYRVQVTDIENNSVLSEKLTFNQPDLLTVDYSITMPSAYNASNGAVRLTVKGGTPGYSYAWNYNNATGDRLSGIPANDEPYTVTVSDTRNCAVTVDPRIIYPLEVKIVVDDSISCYERSDGQLKAIATGGVGVNYSYQWYRVENEIYIPLEGENAVTLSDIGKGIYRVQVTDIENSSIISEKLTFNQPDLLTADYSLTMPSAYNTSDGAIRLNVRGGTPQYFYSWNYNNATGDRLSGIPANDEPYTVTVRDTRNCAVTVAPRIIYPLEVKIVVDDSISCYGRADGQLRAVATGGVGVNCSYQWYKIENGTDILLSGENAVTLSGIGEGVYHVSATDVENNTSTTTLTFNQPGLLDANVEYLRSVLSCKFGANGSVQLSVSGGVTPYAYLWQDGAVTSSNSSLTEGVHTFEVTDRRGCKYNSTVTISSPDELILKSFHIPPKAYNSDDASVWVEAVGGTSPYKYVWEGRSETTASIGGIMFGEYTVTVTDANGCTKKITETVPNPPLLEASVIETKSVTCNGRSDGALTVVSQGGVGEHYYTWYRVMGNVLTGLVSTKDIDNLPTGTYRVRVIDDNGIVAYSEDFTLVEPPVLTVSTTTSGVACNDAAGWVEATVAGGTAPYSYLWTSGHSTARVENLAGDKYLVFVTDARACEVKGIAEVRLSPNMTVETTVVQPVCANDGSIVLNVKGGIAPYTYLWNDGSTEKQRDNLSAGVYSVTVSGANGCTQYVQINLETPEPHTVNLDEDITLCKGQQIELNVAGNDSQTQYKWYRDGKLFASTPAVSLSEQGFYNVEIITPQGCRSEGSINVSVIENEISADFTVATKAIRNEIVRLVNISYPAPENIEWIIPEDPRIELVEKTDEYIDLIFDENDVYSIGISSTVGACQKTVYKDVKILNRGDVPEYVLEEDAFLKSFITYPNPNTGEFTAKIELSEIADIHLRLISIAGSIVDERDAKNNNSYEIRYNIANLQGVYILQLISSKANTSLNLIINGY